MLRPEPRRSQDEFQNIYDTQTCQRTQKSRQKMLCALADFVEAASSHKFEVIEPQRFSTHTITKALYVSPKSYEQ